MKKANVKNKYKIMQDIKKERLQSFSQKSYFLTKQNMMAATNVTVIQTVIC